MPFHNLVSGHHVVFYAACMLRMILGTRVEQLQIVQKLCSVETGGKVDGTLFIIGTKSSG